MKSIILGLALLSLAACAQLTGDPVKDCLAARNAVITAQGLATATAAIAAANPQSPRMQEAAALAAANLGAAQAQQAAACPAPAN